MFIIIIPEREDVEGVRSSIAAGGVILNMQQPLAISKFINRAFDSVLADTLIHEFNHILFNFSDQIPVETRYFEPNTQRDLEIKTGNTLVEMYKVFVEYNKTHPYIDTFRLYDYHMMDS